MSVGVQGSPSLGTTLNLLFSSNSGDSGADSSSESASSGSGNKIKEKVGDPNLDKNMNQIIPGSVQKSKSWKSQYENTTLREVIQKAQKGDKAAKDMWKLYRDRERLMKKPNKKYGRDS